VVERETHIERFLNQAGWSDAKREKLPGDASFRRYVRLHGPEKRRALLMDAAPPQENVRAYLAIARLLRGMGLGSPAVFNQDAENGLLLIEDLGDDTYTRLLAQGAAEEPLYALAVDVLIELTRRFKPSAAPFLGPYDDEKLLNEAALLVDWYWPAVSDKPADPKARAEYLSLWRALFPIARRAPTTLVLRDYHVDNLMRVPNRAGLLACGLLDFQDAVLGPQSYDLVSLLEDARRDIEPGLAQRMKRRYLDAFPKLDQAAFEASYAVLGAQRHAKVIGIFTRLAVRDRKPHYLVHIPRVWRLVERSLKHPALANLARWFETHIPKPSRRVPPVS